MAEEKEEGQRDGEVGRELRVGGRHAVALAVHFLIPTSISAFSF